MRDCILPTPSRTGVYKTQGPESLSDMDISGSRRPMVRIDGPLALDGPATVRKSLGLVRTSNLLLGPRPLGAGRGLLRIQ